VTGLGLDPDAAAVLLDDLLADRKAQAAAFVAAGVVQAMAISLARISGAREPVDVRLR
jgi:hypothetical protein